MEAGAAAAGFELVWGRKLVHRWVPLSAALSGQQLLAQGWEWQQSVQESAAGWERRWGLARSWGAGVAAAAAEVVGAAVMAVWQEAQVCRQELLWKLGGSSELLLLMAHRWARLLRQLQRMWRRQWGLRMALLEGWEPVSGWAWLQEP